MLENVLPIGIAIGIAALLGYRFQRNFNQPYRAETLADFWRRWHMSLSSWLRDYLYIPLGGIWHGAAWKFVIWGALHGGMLAVERMFSGRASAARETKRRAPWRRALGIL